MLIQSVVAQEAFEDNINQLEDTKEKIEVFGDKDARNEYLKQEWTKILEKTTIGKAIVWFGENILKPLNPFFKIVLGVEYSFSLAFIFAIIIWLILFVLISPAAIGMSNNIIIGLIISFCITCIIGLTGVIRKAVDFLNFAITNIWIAWISLLIAIMIAVLLGKLTKQTIKGMKETSKKEQLERDKKIIHTEAKIEEEEFKKRSKDNKN